MRITYRSSEGAASSLTCWTVRALSPRASFNCVCLFCPCSSPSLSLQHPPARPTQVHTNNSLRHAWYWYSFCIYYSISFRVSPGWNRLTQTHAYVCTCYLFSLHCFMGKDHLWCHSKDVLINIYLALSPLPSTCSLSSFMMSDIIPEHGVRAHTCDLFLRLLLKTKLKLRDLRWFLYGTLSKRAWFVYE